MEKLERSALTGQEFAQASSGIARLHLGLRSVWRGVTRKPYQADLETIHWEIGVLLLHTGTLWLWAKRESKNHNRNIGPTRNTGRSDHNETGNTHTTSCGVVPKAALRVLEIQVASAAFSCRVLFPELPGIAGPLSGMLLGLAPPPTSSQIHIVPILAGGHF